MDFKPGDVINIPCGTKYFFEYNTDIREIVLPVTAVIKKIEGNYIYLKNSYIVVLLDSLLENLSKPNVQYSNSGLIEAAESLKFILDSISDYEWEEFDDEETEYYEGFKIGDKICIPKGTPWRDNNGEWRQLKEDTQGIIDDISIYSIWLQNFDGTFLKEDINLNMIIKTDILNKKPKPINTFNVSDKITSNYNIWTSYKQKDLDKIYKKKPTEEELKEADIEANLWTNFLEYYHNRQTKNNIVDGGN